MGHSMGGGQVLNYIFHPESPYNRETYNRPNFTGVLLYSPLIAIDPASRPSKLTVSAGRVVAKLVPNKQRYSPLDHSLLSRNEDVVREVMADELCHDTGTFEGLAGMLDRGIFLEGMFAAGPKAWVESELPFWFGHGDGDRITSYAAVKDFVEALTENGGDVKFCTYEGAYHKLHAELPETTERFLADVKAWILSKVPGKKEAVVQHEVEGVEGEDTAAHGDAEAEGKAKL
jgi:acylglycerol lipase